MARPPLPSLPTFIISILITLGVVGTLWAFAQKDPARIYSPGPLAHGHEKIKNCNACHTAWKGVPDINCTTADCHPRLQLTSSTKPGIAGIHQKASQESCLACHTEHLGRENKITTAFDHAMLEKGASCLECHRPDTPKADFHAKLTQNCSECHSTQTWKRAKFDHNLSQFPLTGKHVDLSCQDCHKNGQFKGLDGRCFSCHQQNDKHKGAFGNDCAKCHSTSTWKEAKFDHKLTQFPLTGKHMEVSCEECHKGGTYQKVDKSCFACHQQDDKHKGSLGTNCAQCHTTVKWSAVTFVHKFPIDRGEHRGISCRDCHENQMNFKEFTCISCHEHSQARMDREHRGEVRNYRYDSQSCLRCHLGGRKEEGEGEEGEGDDD